VRRFMRMHRPGSNLMMISKSKQYNKSKLRIDQLNSKLKSIDIHKLEAQTNKTIAQQLLTRVKNEAE
jgi:hypothetical protein